MQTWGYTVLKMKSFKKYCEKILNSNKKPELKKFYISEIYYPNL